MSAQASWSNRSVATMYSLLLLLSSSVWAGQVEYPNVLIDLATRTASGSFVGARYSADTVQYLLCRTVVDAPDRTEPYVVCEARDKQGTTISCLGTEPGYVDAVLGVRDYGHIVFTVSTDGACDLLEVGTFASHLPASAP